jgi:hypothetical protein
MMASRGMGDINPSKMPGGKTMHRKDGDKFNDNGVEKRRKDGDEFTMYAEGGEVWDKDRPKGLGKPKKLSPAKKASAKSMAKAAGRPYPNLVDNMRAAKK